MGACDLVRLPVPRAGVPAGRHSGALTVRHATFIAGTLVVAVLVFFAPRVLGNDYIYFAGFVILQYIVLATAWNILGGYCGYVNFGTAAFFALGAYTTVAIHKLAPMPLPVVIIAGGIVS
ncbi:MAG: hypothetical protein J0H62_10845, partial [Rhizobiales bacterium]|nr:hypothetical protein [Hyphomicrobiales bacterium]